jgi:hypothetical protein
MRSADEYERVRRLLDEGLNDCAASRASGVPRSTVREWRVGKTRDAAFRSGAPCHHDFVALPAGHYAYLLGLYLGDGYVARAQRVWRLRIVLDAKYPGIVGACVQAMEAVMPGQHAHRYQRSGTHYVEVGMYSKHWPCLLPQHGPGRKHDRRIVLTEWQQLVISDARKSLLRGLIHSDGCRIIATERKGTYTRRAVRYAFSNRSEDILEVFCESCDELGVRWTRSSPHQVSIYRKDSVARMDEFVGPKR